MLTTTLTFILKIFNKYKWVIFTAILGFICWWMMGTINDLKQDNQRVSTNLSNVINNFGEKINKERLDNGKLIQSIEALTVKTNEFKTVNNELYDRIRSLDIKIKNIKSATDINHNYNISIDTLRTIVKTAMETDSIPYDINEYKVYGFSKRDDFIDLSGDVIVFDNDSITPLVHDFKVQLSDSLLIIPEIKYKRRWLFWKKATGVKLKVNSTSPYYEVKSINHYEFKK